jgi:16S rRNA (guanine527-N7)-methyltransferase
VNGATPRPENRILADGLARLGIDRAPGLLERFQLFIDELLTWNKKTNLVGTSDPDEVVRRHILDSLSALRLIKGRATPILDIGAGAGFPSVPLALADGALLFHAVEKRKKRAMFLRNVAVILGLKNLTVFEKDVRELKGAYDTVVARGVGDLLELFRLAERFLKERGMIIAYKGKMSEIEKEVARLRADGKNGKNLSLRIQKVDVPSLEEEERNIVIIEVK